MKMRVAETAGKWYNKSNMQAYHFRKNGKERAYDL